MPETRVNHSRKTRRRYWGMTFTEVLIATLILSLAMVPILQAMSRVHLFSSRMEKTCRSVILAGNQMEELRARAASDFVSSWSVSDQVLAEGYLGRIEADTDPLLRTVSVFVGYDENRNGSLESSEILATLRTKIAKLQ